MARKSFKAVLVGGGVAGLTLANILEQLGIDFVLLESHGDWAPQVGASIGLYPNGMRILDQLGCKETLSEFVPALETIGMTINGKPIITLDHWNLHIAKRHGYGVEFCDRQRLLEVLYNNLKHKENLLLNQRVTKVTASESGVTVETQAGESFRGDIVVGLDGIHSTIRQEMSRIAAEVSPGSLPVNEMKRVQIEYRCLFGIARPHERLPRGVITTAMGRGYSHLIVDGPGNHLYFFLMEKLPKKLRGDQTPRYNQQDVKAMAEAHRNDLLTDDCTFGQVFDSHFSVGLTPLHEHASEKWHYGRIITLGDSVHKSNPITGMGGNSAMESVAALANALKKRLDRLPCSSTLSAEDVDSIFRETQALRNERARMIVTVSRERQALFALNTSLARHGSRLLPWLISEEDAREFNTGIMVESVRVEGLSVPFRPHFTPFTDELPAKPIRNVLLPRVAVGLVLVGLAYLAGHGLKLKGRPLPTSFPGHASRDTFTGHQAVDKLLSLLTSVFSIGLTSPVVEQRIQIVYFLPMLTPMVLIWLVEANRQGNLQTLRGRILTWPGLFALAYQLFTIARIGPIYFLLTLLISSNPVYHRPTSRVVDPDVARALLPAVGLGFVLPTVLMLLPRWSDPGLWLDFMTFWQIAPLTVGPLTALLASMIRGSRRAADGRRLKRQQGPREEDPTGSAFYANRDVPHLLTAYATVFWASAALHVFTLGYIAVPLLSSTSLSLSRTFLDVPWPWGPAGGDWAESLAGGACAAIFVLFKWDLLGYTATLLVWCLHTVFEMRRLGYVATADACRAALAVPPSLVLLGPGAMYAGIWYWREKTIAGLSRMEEGGGKKNR